MSKGMIKKPTKMKLHWYSRDNNMESNIYVTLITFYKLKYSSFQNTPENMALLSFFWKPKTVDDKISCH